MSFRSENQNPNPNPNPNPSPTPPSKKRWSDIWLRSKPLTEMVMAMKLQSPLAIADRTLLLSDELLLKILAAISDSQTQRNANSLVCKRWLNLQGRLLRSLAISDWNFLLSGRLIHRFPNLNHVDLTSATFVSPRNSGILLSNRVLTVHLTAATSPNWCFCEDAMLPVEVIDTGLASLAAACPNLRRLRLIGASEMGVLSVAEDCPTLQDLELQRCSDAVLRGIAACRNLQILKLVGHVDGFYNSVVSDIGLTILAQGCKRLVKLELSGCEGSFDGVKAIGKCCQMLEELTFSDHRMDDGWLAALSFCENLKTLRIVSCKRIDSNPGMEEYLGSCSALERLHLEKCLLRDKKSVAALFSVCRNVREVVLQDCWGFDDGIFSLAITCRRVKLLYLEGCSLITTDGLESVIHSWKELQRLRVVSCKNIKDNEISPALATLFTTLKELRWSPDTKSLLPSSLAGTTMGKKGGKFFRRTR
ncbi:F-box protein At5g07670 [Cajanus cajan]|uniref:F-box protein At5g07670 family n=1 Tax=Cajanus cajan TaxID=3821 RepID=A0A151TLL3_CAJCA|nr:F-box protein At5g07670 [Cajanus cajan]KYP67925.1 F-box protein At5g07670 family [Cajanus cajan]